MIERLVHNAGNCEEVLCLRGVGEERIVKRDGNGSEHKIVAVGALGSGGGGG